MKHAHMLAEQQGSTHRDSRGCLKRFLLAGLKEEHRELRVTVGLLDVEPLRKVEFQQH